MKHTYKLLTCIALVLVGCACLLLRNKPLQQLPAIPPKSADIASSSHLANIQKTLAEREYQISFDSQTQLYQSPNRKHNLRAYYQPGRLSVRNRKDSVGHNFNLQLTTKGIFADEKQITLPQQSAEIENGGDTLNIVHSGFTEQYINTAAGLRQNFIIAQAPTDTRRLVVKLAAEGLKVGSVSDDAVEFAEGNTRLSYQDLHCWDADGTPLAATFSGNGQEIAIHVNVESASFPITIDPLLTNGNPGNADAVLEGNQAIGNAGAAVSSAGDVNGDGYSDVLVGAPMYDNGEVNEGVAFLYYGSAQGLPAAPSVTLEANQADSRFGTSVSTAGDVNRDGYSDIIIGAPLFDKGEVNEGAAFVYLGSANGISGVPSVVLEYNQANSNFGQSVALAGDVNNDNYSDLLVGVPLYDKGQTDEGGVFIYHGSATGIASYAHRLLESNQVDSRFGMSVAGAGDVNGDGFGDIIIGSILYDKGQLNEGAAFVYYGSVTGIVPNQLTALESNQTGSIFGWSVSSAGDLNGDGYSDVIVGAYQYDAGETNEGAAFIYQGSPAGTQTNPSNVLQSNQTEARMGISVACAGDVNGDGYSDVLVGAYLYDNGQNNEGAAFVYQGSPNGLENNASTTLESDQSNSSIGMSVASAGDVNGDGYSDVLIGAPAFDKGQGDEGVVMVWEGGAYSTDMVTSSTVGDEQNQPGANMACSVNGAGDVNGDGFDDVVVGAPDFDNGQANEGAAFIYYGNKDGTPNPIIPNLILESNQANAKFGISTSRAGDVNGDGFDDLIVGAYEFDNGEQDEGAAFIFHGSPNGLGNLPATILEYNQTKSNLGWSVSTAGDVNGDGYSDVIVGAYNFDNGENDEGAALVFYGSDQGIKKQGSSFMDGNSAARLFGWSVSGAGDVDGDGFGDIIVGSGTGGEAAFYRGSSNGIMLSSLKTLHVDGQNSVSSAGDLDGDGYLDVVIGAPYYIGETGINGACLIFYGTPAGLTDQKKFVIEGSGNLSQFGFSVAGAGDVNGDGFSEIIIGSPNDYRLETSGGVQKEIRAGKAFLYSGSPSGIQLNALGIFEAGVEGTKMGYSVGGLGDVNGDGFDDVISGALNFNNGTGFVCYGNLRYNMYNNLRLYNTDLTTPINHNQFPQNSFGAGFYSKSFLGRSKGKLVWETKPVGQGFSKANNSITHSTASNGSQNAYSNLGLTGVELKNVIPKQGPSTKVRVRVKYDPVLALTGQTYGPWRYLSSYLLGNIIAPVPEEGNVAQRDPVVTNLAAEDVVVAYPNPVTEMLYVKSNNIEHIAKVQITNLQGYTVWNSQVFRDKINCRDIAPGTYLLTIRYLDGSANTSRIVISK